MGIVDLSKELELFEKESIELAKLIYKEGERLTPYSKFWIYNEEAYEKLMRNHFYKVEEPYLFYLYEKNKKYNYILVKEEGIKDRYCFIMDYDLKNKMVSYWIEIRSKSMRYKFEDAFELKHNYKEFNIEIQEYNRSFKSESIKEKYNKMLEVYKKKNYYNRFEIMDI